MPSSRPPGIATRVALYPPWKPSDRGLRRRRPQRQWALLDADEHIGRYRERDAAFAVNEGSDSIAAFHIGDTGLLRRRLQIHVPERRRAPPRRHRAATSFVANKASDGVRGSTRWPPTTRPSRSPATGRSAHGQRRSSSPLASCTQASSSPRAATSCSLSPRSSGAPARLPASVGAWFSPRAPGSPVPLPDSLRQRQAPTLVGQPGRPRHRPLLDPRTPGISETIRPSPPSTSRRAGQPRSIGGDRPRRRPALLELGERRRPPGSTSRTPAAKRLAGTRRPHPRHPRAVQTYQLPGGGNPWGLRIDCMGKLLFVDHPPAVSRPGPRESGPAAARPPARDGRAIVDEIDGVTGPAPGSPRHESYWAGCRRRTLAHRVEVRCRDRSAAGCSCPPAPWNRLGQACWLSEPLPGLRGAAGLRAALRVAGDAVAGSPLLERAKTCRSLSEEALATGTGWIDRVVAEARGIRSVTAICRRRRSPSARPGRSRRRRCSPVEPKTMPSGTSEVAGVGWPPRSRGWTC